MSTPLPTPDSCNYTERIFKTNAPSPLAVTLEQLEVQCNVCKLPWISLYLLILLIYMSIWNNSAGAKQFKRSKVIFSLQTRLLQIGIIFWFYHTHISSNSTATQGPNVVELITFAALSWSGIVLMVILSAIWCSRLITGKQSIEDHVLELYNHAMWEDLVVPALDTVFSVGWCAPLD